MKKFNIVHRIRGYENRQEPTNVDNKQHGVLLPPSENVFITSDGTIQSRSGTESFGTSLGSAVYSDKVWETNRNQSITLVSADNKLYASFNEDWVELSTVNTNYLDYAIWWDDVTKKDIVIIAQGTEELLSWDGVLGKIDTIDGTKIGSDLKPMYDFGIRVNDTLTIAGTNYNVDSFDGDLAVLDSAGAVVGDVFIGEVKTQATFSYTYIDSAHDSPHTFTNRDLKDDFDFTFDTIDVENNQLISGSKNIQRYFKSKNTDWKDFSYNIDKGRIVGEGDSWVLDGTATSINVEPQKGRAIISCGKDKVYEVKDVNSTVNAEVNYTVTTTTIKRLLSGFGSGILSKQATTLVKDSLAFLTFDNEVDTLNRIENLDTPQGKPLSWLIDLDMANYGLEDTNMLYYKNNLYITIPNESRVIIYDFEQQIWQPPVTLSATYLTVVDDKLVYFDNSGQSHWFLKGTNDNGAAFTQNASFHYDSFGDRANLKKSDTNYTEGYLSEGGEIKVRLLSEYAGSGGTQTNTINKKTKSTQFFNQDQSQGIGQYNFGRVPFGSSNNSSEYVFTNRINKFRDYFKYKPKPFFEQRFEISTNTLDTVFILIAYGQNVRAAATNPSKK